MSKGIGAHPNKKDEDDHIVINEYGGYNLNELEYRNVDHVYDGTVMIQRDCFIVPEIHKKLKKLPSGRKKLTTKRIPVPVHYGEMI